MTSLFFYGTLRHLPLLEVVLGRPLDDIRQEAASLADHAVLGVQGGLFPALVRQKGFTAQGIVVGGLTARDLDRLNFYEGSFAYDLAQVTLTDGRRVQVYYPDDIRWQTEAPWELAAWQQTWGDMTVEAAREVMGYFGIKSRAQVDAMFAMIRARAASQINARHTRHGRNLFSGSVVVERHSRPYADHFVLDDYALRYQQFDGTLSAAADRAVFVATDAAIVLPYDPVRDRVLLVEQFRIGPWRRGDKSWQMEPVAGRIDAGEDAETCARREAHEEAHIDIVSLEKVAECYPTPGTSTEFYHIFVGLCDLPDDVARFGGLDDENEDIRTHLLSFDALMAMNEDRAVANAPLVTASYWLAHHRNRLRSGQGADTP